jgi:hypothetical protein
MWTSRLSGFSNPLHGSLIIPTDGLLVNGYPAAIRTRLQTLISPPDVCQGGIFRFARDKWPECH